LLLPIPVDIVSMLLIVPASWCPIRSLNDRADEIDDLNRRPNQRLVRHSLMSALLHFA